MKPKPLLTAVLLILFKAWINAQSTEVSTESVAFESEGIVLSGTIHSPRDPCAAVVLVHGSGQEPRMTNFAVQLCLDWLVVLTYDKRGVGESGGIYVGPEVGTNNVDSTNLHLLAKDAGAAVDVLYQRHEELAVGLAGASQAGWIIPIAAAENPRVDFMVLFSCPVITTLEQLRFQFYTDGRTDFWENHTEADAREHTLNDPDRYQFAATDPNLALRTLSIPGLWLFGKKDIQIPVSLCIENLNILKARGQAFEYVLFTELGHNTTSTEITAPIDIATHWIRQQATIIKRE
ncbi:MAG: alpha/beta hydrolase [Bacteroidota bacterium]